MKPLKVLIITPTIYPDFGGCAKSVSILNNELLSAGCVVKVVRVNESLFEGRNSNVTSLKVNPRNLFAWFYLFFALRKHLKSVDVVHVYNVFMIPIVALASLGLNVQRLATLNNYNWGCINPIYNARNKCTSCSFLTRTRCSNVNKNFVFTLVSPLLSVFDRFFVFSGYASKLYGFHTSNRVEYIKIQNFKPNYNFIHNNQFNELDNSKVVFAFIGTLDDRKGVDVLLNAVKNIADRFSIEDFKVVFLGKGRSDIVKLITTSRYCESLYFPDESRDFFELLNRIDVLIHPSRWNEPFARVWMEAAAHQCALLLSDVETNHEILSGSAVFFKNCDPLDLASKMSDFIVSDSKLEEYKSLSSQWYSSLEESSVTVETILSSYCCKRSS